MKIAIACLCLLGIAAAACAAFLISGLAPTATGPARSLFVTEKPETNPSVVVLYATRGIPAMTVVDGGMVESKSMPRAQAPAGYLASATDVVGKVASRSLALGQPFTQDCFGDLSGPRLFAGVIPKGKRAVGISVTDYAGLEGLIYPGSTVDVMVSFKPDGQSQRETVTTTLIEKVQVLAFDRQTIVSPGRTMMDVDASHSGSTRHVTLLVDSKQSKALELGMEQGTLSLALRNPMDSGESDKEAVTVRNLMGEEQPTAAQMPAPETVRAWATALHEAMSLFRGEDSNKAAPATQPVAPVAAVVSAPPAPTVSAPPAVSALPPPPPHWETLFIHGDQVETLSFEMPASGDTSGQGPNVDKLSPADLARLRLATQPSGPTRELFRSQ
jgi:pilus assembly protein CpaB